jgi:hypothetical protein
MRSGILALFIAMPLCGQGLTITMKETGPVGETAPVIQTDRTHARLDAPSLASQVLYDSSTKTLRLVVPLLRTYREYTPTTIQSAPAIGGPGQPASAPMPITYKRAGSGKVKDWTCTTYEGFRGSEKVVELCAAEGSSVGLTSADFTIVQQAIDMVKAVASPELIERIPTYGNAANQGFVGFPVRRVSFRNGQPESTVELVEIRRAAVPVENFAVPAGFTKAP